MIDKWRLWIFQYQNQPIWVITRLVIKRQIMTRLWHPFFQYQKFDGFVTIFFSTICSKIWKKEKYTSLVSMWREFKNFSQQVVSRIHPDILYEAVTGIATYFQLCQRNIANLWNNLYWNKIECETSSLF